jgi:hypothetical protein
MIKEGADWGGLRLRFATGALRMLEEVRLPGPWGSLGKKDCGERTKCEQRQR